MGDVTEERRKAVVEKFAAMWFGLDHAHATPATLPRTWARLCNEYRRNAQAALEAVGYFKDADIAAAAREWIAARRAFGLAAARYHLGASEGRAEGFPNDLHKAEQDALVRLLVAVEEAV